MNNSNLAKSLNFSLAIIWSVLLIANIVSCASGNASPSWASYFCAAGLLCLNYWEKLLLSL